MPKRASWATRFGFYLAAIGSSCGLGNLWRFPYIVGENGGGAFVLLYVFLAIVLGLPLLIGELMLGRSTSRSVLSAVGRLEWKGKRPFNGIARASIVLCLVVLSYYAVISGWVLHFAIQFLISLFGFQSLSQQSSSMALLLNNGWLQTGLASVHLLLSVVVVARGVQEGLEKWIGLVMPVFAALLVILVGKSLSLPSAPEALRFLFYPDFSKITLSSFIHAIGHVCFTLSVGFGTMVTFGSYLKSDDHIPSVGFRVAMIDTLLSLSAGLLIFPIALQASNVPLTDPGLLFEVLPRFLLEQSGGALFGLAFFVCLYLAALGASIGLLEVIVSNWVDQGRGTRVQASWSSGVLVLALGLVPTFSGSLWRLARISQKGLLELVDSLLINWTLPMIALGMSLAISYGFKESEKDKLFIDPNRIESVSLYSHWQFVLRWLVPGCVITAMALRIVALF